MTIKKTTLKKAAAILSGLMLFSLLVLTVGPVVFVDAAEPTCGDGVCDFTSENNDLCPEDCHCTDNGVEDPGEGCGCKDVICEGEALSSACGTPVGANGECPGILVDSGGVCWDRCECQGICGEDDGGTAGLALACPDYSGGGLIITSVPGSNPNPCSGGFVDDYTGTWVCYGTGAGMWASLCCSGMVDGGLTGALGNCD